MSYVRIVMNGERGGNDTVKFQSGILILLRRG
jgi:hypothetical protein